MSVTVHSVERGGVQALVGEAFWREIENDASLMLLNSKWDGFALAKRGDDSIALAPGEYVNPYEAMYHLLVIGEDQLGEQFSKDQWDRLFGYFAFKRSELATILEKAEGQRIEAFQSAIIAKGKEFSQCYDKGSDAVLKAYSDRRMGFRDCVASLSSGATTGGVAPGKDWVSV